MAETSDHRRHQPTHVEVIEIYEELLKVITQTGEKVCAYAEGHDDASIAARLGASINSIISIRRKKFGTFYEGSDTAPTIAISPATLQTLLNEMHALKAEHDELKLKHNDLCLQLSLNKDTKDCRHLMVGAHALTTTRANGRSAS